MSAHEIGSVEWLRCLKTVTNALLEEARELHRVKGNDSPFNGESVNWGKLRCVSARWIRDDDGLDGAEIHVEEAAPGGAYFLGQWVTERLEELGWKGVGWKTEW